MKKIKYAFTCFLMINATLVSAESVKMYSHEKPPSAEEMARVLFGSMPGKKTPKMKTRSISFAKKSPSTSNAVEPENALKQAKAAGIGLTIQFGYNSAEILPNSFTALNEVAKMLQMEQLQQEKLLIEGHTDASGSAAYNRNLSKQRAEAVRNYLVNRFKISSSRLYISGKGEEEPLPGLSPYSSENRRVQFYKIP